ncbi:phosphatase domain-containing protein [Aestuariibaculum marinum]|uniref:DUF2183 domain-containing protein n=1 Tax=Aestuariibaculum marinum TaxID=2683592 RepID=A0A8J6Q036_9FLAO|nr:phosphatase domain-containing protein [Aestuariibaculum marinum]MBD0825427.1 DUF2183 domain-containing protein [Aestuariibaculum marinum]
MAKPKNTPIIWQLSIINLLNNKTLITGVILKKAPTVLNKNVGILKNLNHVLKTYFRKPFSNKPILINTKNESFETKTDAHGGFQLTLDQSIQLPISITNNGSTLKSVQNYPISFAENNSAFGVISDIDDTLIKSYTANNLKRIGTISFTPPQRRQPIQFTLNFLESINKTKSNIYCVSKSESNLFSLLNYFIQLDHKLPEAPLFLTPYLSLKQLIFDKKPKDFKYQTITKILNLTQQKFILIGDDTQRDMIIYYHIASKYPDRILKIYIRQTKHQRKTHQQNMWLKLQPLSTPSYYFKTDTSIDFEQEVSNLKTMAL